MLVKQEPRNSYFELKSYTATAEVRRLMDGHCKHMISHLRNTQLETYITQTLVMYRRLLRCQEKH